MKIPTPALSRDGALRVYTTVEFPLTLVQLAEYLWWATPPAEQWGADRPQLTCATVHARVRRTVYEHGVRYFVEDDAEFDHNGGREWALAQVRRAYGFPGE